MFVRNLIAAAALVAVPMIALHAQVPVPGADSNRTRTWGKNPVPSPQAGSEAVNDSSFVRQALTGNLLEVRLGRLAESKASSPAVKQFAQRMITDHTNMQNQWAALAARNRLQAKPALDPAQDQDARQLAQLSGTEFDRAYMSQMVQEHRKDLDEFRRVGTTADAPEVRELATTGVATIQQHLTMAQQVSRQIGVSNVAVNPEPRANDKVGNRRDRDNDVREDLKDFVHEVADDHLMQVQMGQMAQRRAKNSEVKQLANRMVDDFNKWQDRWTDLAKKNGFAFEPALGPMHKSQRNRVEKASEANFDRVYLSTVIENLQGVVSDFQNEGKKARSDQVRNLVGDELHVVQQHLAAARRLEQNLNTRAEASGKNRRVSSRK
jgi:predicted outer membrane protein